MWSKLDDTLIDHRKIFAAADVIGANGGAIAIGLYAVGLMYANKHLTDGFLPAAVVRSFPHVEDPIAVAAALTKAGLWTREKRRGVDGFVVHDFAEFNFTATAIKAKRRRDRKRKAEARDHYNARRRVNGRAS
jgi:hypothetical protein